MRPPRRRQSREPARAGAGAGVHCLGGAENTRLGAAQQQTSGRARGAMAFMMRLAQLLGGVTCGLALNNGRLRTPPMGFSDACLGGGENTRLGSAQLQTVATGFISSGLAELGYTRMNLDDSWELFNRKSTPTPSASWCLDLF